MDSLTLLLQYVKDELSRVGTLQAAANDSTADPLATALANAEVRARRVLGGTKHYIRRDAKTDTLRMLGSLPRELTPQQISERTGLSVRHVQEMRKLLD